MFSNENCKNVPLWLNEGDYHVAKAIQLCHLQIISNIFLGIAAFQWEKIVIGCFRAYLESSRSQDFPVEEELCGPAVVESIRNGAVA